MLGDADYAEFQARLSLIAENFGITITPRVLEQFWTALRDDFTPALFAETADWILKHADCWPVPALWISCADTLLRERAEQERQARAAVGESAYCGDCDDTGWARRSEGTREVWNPVPAWVWQMMRPAMREDLLQRHGGDRDAVRLMAVVPVGKVIVLACDCRATNPVYQAWLARERLYATARQGRRVRRALGRRA